MRRAVQVGGRPSHSLTHGSAGDKLIPGQGAAQITKQHARSRVNVPRERVWFPASVEAKRRTDVVAEYLLLE